MTYEQAIRRLNDAAYEAIKACNDTVQYPDVDRQTLRQIARDSDRLVDESGPIAETRKVAGAVLS